MTSGHDFEPVTLNWDLAVLASESLAADILHNFHGRQLCDSEILGEEDVARPVKPSPRHPVGHAKQRVDTLSVNAVISSRTVGAPTQHV